MRILRNLIGLALLLAMMPARATIVGVAVMPAAATVSVGAPAPLPLTWSVSAVGSLPPIASSPAGTFLNPVNGQTLGTGGTPLTANLLGGVTNILNGSVSESLQVPATVLQLAVQQQLTTIDFVRTFQDQTGPAGARQGIVRIAILAPTLSGASVLPSTLSASLQAPGPFGLTWTVRSAPGAGTAVSSQGLVSTPGGRVLQVDPTPLAVNLASGSGSAFESFSLAPAVVATALRLGVNTLVLERQFVLGANATGVIAQATLHLGGSASGPLTLSRVVLQFDNRTLLRVVRAGDGLTAQAEIDYAGSGRLDGLWEVAAPPSTLGQPVFVPLATTSVNLAGGGRTQIESPPLPVLADGDYYVRFVVRSPQAGIGDLVIEYAVSGSAQVPPLPVHRPRQDATLAADTVFDWAAAPGAVYYELQLFAPGAPPDAPPLTGLLLPAAQRHALLSQLARAHLQPGHTYRWRIVALDRQGRIAARSALYTLRTP